MFSNFTEETGTGTGTTISLAGAVASRLPFSASFADGDLVAYAIEDSSGSIKVSGVGTYVSATDEITRNDSWNYNGTVVDKNPTTNIALSGGTHKVRCDVVEKNIVSYSDKVKRSAGISILNGVVNSSAGANKRNLYATSSQEAMCFLLKESAYVSTLHIKVATLDAAATAEMGLSNLVDGVSDSSYIAQGSIDVTSTGYKSITINKFLAAGYYVVHLACSGSTVLFTCGNQTYNNAAVAWTPFSKHGNGGRDHPVDFYGKFSAVAGVLDADPSTILGTTSQNTNERPLLFHMER